MTYLTLSNIKKHLNIDSTFTDDDTYITALGNAAEDVIEKYIDFPLSQLTDNQGHIPVSLSHAMLLWVGSMYAIRESVSNVNMSPIPHALELICDLYRDYKVNKTQE